MERRLIDRWGFLIALGVLVGALIAFAGGTRVHAAVSATSLVCGND